MAASITGAEIRAELAEAWHASDYHGTACSCCASNDGTDELRTALAHAVMYATDRYRPGEGYQGVTEDAIDALVGQVTEQTLWAARTAITEATAAKLAGVLAREEEAA